MASPTPELISALRATANRLSDGTAYQWTHMGACNCGHLAQTVTRKSASEIHALGLYIEDIIHLERLSDPEVLVVLPPGKRPLNHKHRDHVVLYLRTWADQLEAEWLRRTSLQLPITAPRETTLYVGQELSLTQSV
jgi:hypothetical protein